MDLIRHFVVFEAEKDKKEGTVKISKKIAQYQQYNAVQKALASTVNATKKDSKAGIVWHTQGSGKSLTMVFYTGKMVLNPTLENPTVIVLTDRNDLDDQLFGTFSRCHALLQAKATTGNKQRRAKELLQVSSGGIIFTTIQKFFPEGKKQEYPLLSERKNIIIIADEAHRSQYGFGLKVPKNVDSKKLSNMDTQNTSETPCQTQLLSLLRERQLRRADRSTPAVFGKFIDTYDINQAVEDGSTVRIFYESRLPKLELKPEERPYIDQEFEEVTEGEEVGGQRIPQKQMEPT